MNTVNKNPKRNFQSDGNIATPTAGSQINNAVNNNTNQPPLKGRAKSLQDNNTSSRRPSLLAMIYQALTGRSSRSSNNNINVIDHNANLNINISQQWSAKSMDGSSQASFHRQMRQFKHSQPYNKWTLQFVDPQTEAKFMLYFAKQTLKHWRITVVLMTICQLGLFIASMLNYSAKDAVLQSTYSQKSIPLDQMMDQMTVYCPRGYWCSPCPPNHPCHPYHVGIDAIYMSVLTVICAVSLWLSYRLELERFSQV